VLLTSVLGLTLPSSLPKQAEKGLGINEMSLFLLLRVYHSFVAILRGCQVAVLVDFAAHGSPQGRNQWYSIYDPCYC